MAELTYATVCSGIECMSAAVAPLGGWKPVFFSEIEPFPCSLLKHRYPSSTMQMPSVTRWLKPASGL